jgi:hypothetical protein
MLAVEGARDIQQPLEQVEQVVAVEARTRLQQLGQLPELQTQAAVAAAGITEAQVTAEKLAVQVS